MPVFLAHFKYCLNISTINNNFELYLVNKYSCNISYNLFCTITALIFTVVSIPIIILFAVNFTCIPFNVGQEHLASNKDRTKVLTLLSICQRV